MPPKMWNNHTPVEQPHTVEQAIDVEQAQDVEQREDQHDPSCIYIDT